MPKMTPPLITPPLLLEAQDWEDYQLLDSGHGRKLEQVGAYRFIRPEAQALWPPALPPGAWEAADGTFTANNDSGNSNDSPNSDSGKWKLGPHLPPQWPVRFDGLTFNASPTPFRHFGFFPEQAVHWQWCAEMITAYRQHTGTRPRILNLFGYTGIASLHGGRAGGDVTHVDASKKAIAGAFANRDLAGLGGLPIRYITEDARRFVARERRRGRHYQGVILDPPKYGRGTKGEVWHMHDDIAPLLAEIAALLAQDALFVVLTSYAIRNSFLSLHHAIEAALAGRDGQTESGELMVAEQSLRGFRLGQAIFARWQGSGWQGSA